MGDTVQRKCIPTERQQHDCVELTIYDSGQADTRRRSGNPRVNKEKRSRRLRRDLHPGVATRFLGDGFEYRQIEYRCYSLYKFQVDLREDRDGPLANRR